MPLKPNTRLGRYEIRSQIGAGGMGEVYLAQDAQLDRTVALKILPADVASNGERMRRFIQEAKAAAALTHPAIAHIYEVGESNGTHFIAMEYIDGETLREEIHHEKTPLNKLLKYLAQVAEGLAKAHASSIVHRDLKPDNIMITRDGYAKILDFGLAKLIERQKEFGSDGGSSEVATAILQHSTPGMVMGTVGYMSPEQAQGRVKEIDHRSDIFSFGCILYEAATGRRAFEGKDVLDSLHMIVHAPTPQVKDVNPDTPHDLQRIVRRCLAKEPEKRYQSIKEVAIELDEIRQELKGAANVESPTHPASSEVVASGSNTQADARSTHQSAIGTTQRGVARPTSSAEYIVSGVKGHRLAAAVALLVITVAALGVGYYFYERNSEVAIDSIAILPLTNASNDPDTEYLSDGLTESIINSLTQLHNLRVIARNSAFRYKGKEADPMAVGHELDVRAVLTGRLLQRGDNLMVSVELVDVRDDKQLWGEQYSRNASNALAVQQEISQEISARLRLKLSGEEGKQMTKRETTNPEAYQFYLKGRYYWNKRTAENIKKAIEQFQQAADKDPDYALAYAGLADSYVLLIGEAGYPEGDTLRKAKAFAQRALRIDDSLAEAYTTLALIHEKSWQWDEAEKGYKRAIELNPNYPTAHQWYSIYLRDVGRFDEALTEIKRAQELDPLSLVINENIAEVYLLKGDVNSSIEQCKKVIELDPSFLWGHNDLGMAYLKQGNYTEALAELQRVVEGSGRVGSSLGNLGYALALSGKRSEALAILKELEGKYARQEAVGKDLATVYAGLGEQDQAFAWLEKDFQARSGYLSGIGWAPQFDSLRSDPRYADLMQRMGLTP